MVRRIKFPHEVRVTDHFDPKNGHTVIEWLAERKMKPMIHYDLDMHGGTAGYTSFWFKTKRQARMVLLNWS